MNEFNRHLRLTKTPGRNVARRSTAPPLSGGPVEFLDTTIQLSSRFLNPLPVRLNKRSESVAYGNEFSGNRGPLGRPGLTRQASASRPGICEMVRNTVQPHPCL